MYVPLIYIDITCLLAVLCTLLLSLDTFSELLRQEKNKIRATAETVIRSFGAGS